MALVKIPNRDGDVEAWVDPARVDAVVGEAFDDGRSETSSFRVYVLVGGVEFVVGYRAAANTAKNLLDATVDRVNQAKAG